MPAENKALVGRFMEEVANQANLAVTDELYAPTYVNHRHLPPGVSADRAGWKQLFSWYRAGFPDLHFTIEDQIAEGDKVATRWTVTGTHRGALMGIAPTGKQIAVGGIWISQISGGQVMEEWGNSDELGMMQQLGILPAPAAPPSTATTGAYQEKPIMPTEHIRTMAREFFMEQDRRKGPLSPTLCAIDYTATIGSNPPMDLAGHSAFGVMFYQGFPDLYHTIDDVIVEGNAAAVRFTLRGMHTGEFMGIAPTGKRIKVTAIAIQHLVDGKIARLFGQFDQLGMLQQLGVVPAPGA